MKVHELKCWPQYFQALIDGTKTFELRLNDRNYQVEDVLFLREYDPRIEEYSGRECWKLVTYITEGDNPFGGLCFGYVILGLGIISNEMLNSVHWISDTRPAPIAPSNYDTKDFTNFSSAHEWYPPGINHGW